MKSALENFKWVLLVCAVVVIFGVVIFANRGGFSFPVIGAYGTGAAYYNDFDTETVGQPPSGWMYASNFGAGYAKVLEDPDETGNVFWFQRNDYRQNYAWHRLYRDFSDYHDYFNFEVEQFVADYDRSGYAYVQFYNSGGTVLHEVRIYWDHYGAYGPPADSSTYTVVDYNGIVIKSENECMARRCKCASTIPIEYDLATDVSAALENNPNVDINTLLSSTTTFRYGFYQEAGPGWCEWNKVHIDELHLYNYAVGGNKAKIQVSYLGTTITKFVTEGTTEIIAGIAITPTDIKENSADFECSYNAQKNEDAVITYLGMLEEANESNETPIVTVLYPNGGETVGGTITVTANATDPDGTVTKVDFYYKIGSTGSEKYIGTDTDGSDGWSAMWDTITLSNGNNYMITAIATDNDGELGYDDSDGYFTVYNPEPPKITVYYPNGGETESGTANFSAYTDEGDAEVSAVMFYYTYNDSAPVYLGNGTKLLDLGAREYWVIWWDTTTVPDGDLYKAYAIVVDGNVESGKDTSDDYFTIDNIVENQPPSVTVYYPNGGEIVSGITNVTAYPVNDPDGTVVSVKFYYTYNDSAPVYIGDGTSGGGGTYWSRLWNTTNVSNGYWYKIYAIATDDLGATGDDYSDDYFTVQN